MQRPVVVVVEDEPYIRLVAVDALDEAGFEVMDFATADQAIAYLERNQGQIAALFTDVRLPGETDGIELAQQVCGRFPAVVVLVTSGRFDAERPSDLPPSAHFVTKPWRGRDVARILRSNRSGTEQSSWLVGA